MKVILYSYGIPLHKHYGITKRCKNLPLEVGSNNTSIRTNQTLNRKESSFHPILQKEKQKLTIDCLSPLLKNPIAPLQDHFISMISQ